MKRKLAALCTRSRLPVDGQRLAPMDGHNTNTQIELKIPFFDAHEDEHKAISRNEHSPKDSVSVTNPPQYSKLSS
jgi:hypothetical protein